MTNYLRRAIRRMAGMAGMVLATAAFGADFPTKPIRVIVPAPPGGSVDLVGRLLSVDLGKTLGQQIIVDNRGGASTMIGSELAKNAAPDGYTLLVNTLPFVTNQFVYSKTPYDVIEDFAPISLLSSVPGMLVVHPSLPVHSLRDMLALAKSKPGAITYSTAGAATNPHIAGELMNYMGKVNLFAVHYKGGGPALVSTLSGETHATFVNNIPEALAHIQTKRLRAIGVTSLKRATIAPQIPTIAEAGLPGYEFTTWHALVAPAGTPSSVVAALGEKVRSTLTTPAVTQRWHEAGLEVIASTPDELAAYLKKEVQKWRVVFKERALRAD